MPCNGTHYYGCREHRTTNKYRLLFSTKGSNSAFAGLFILFVKERSSYFGGSAFGKSSKVSECIKQLFHTRKTSFQSLVLLLDFCINLPSDIRFCTPERIFTLSDLKNKSLGAIQAIKMLKSQKKRQSDRGSI